MRRSAILLVPAAVALGLAAEAAAFEWADPRHWIPDLIVGWAFIACGLVAWHRRPESRVGALMVATGFTWFVGNFANAGVGAIAWVASAGIYFHRGPLVHLMLGYPDGRLSSRPVKAAVVIGYGAALVPAVWRSDAATIALSALLVAVSVREYSGAIGRYRRARLGSVLASSAVGLALAGGAIARLALTSGDVTGPSLLTYQAALCSVAAGLLAGLLSASWARAAVTDLVVELGESHAGTLRGELARALGDPSLEVGFWLPERNAYVGGDGRTLSLPERGADRSATVVEHDGRPIAAIVHDQAVLDDPGLVEAVTSATQLAASNARLQAEVRAQVDELAASRRRVLAAGDEERRRLERRLHDGAEQRLQMLAETLRRVETTGSGGAKEQALRAEGQLTQTLDELSRLAAGLHPRILSEQGLKRALESLAHGSPVAVEMRVTTDPMPQAVEAAVYFVCAEALSNVAKYASASHIDLSVETEDGWVKVFVEDDGVGGADPTKGSGLSGLIDRVETLGGVLRAGAGLVSGTRLAAEIPIGDGTLESD